MPKKLFQPGHKFAKGGKRPGAGRPPNWFREQCRDALERSGLVGRMEEIATGNAKIKNVIVVNGKKVIQPIRPSFRDQITAFEKIANIGIPQKSEVESKNTVALDTFTADAEENRGLPPA